MSIEHIGADSSTPAIGPARREDLPVLTGLRFLAAFSVLIGHSAVFILNFETKNYDAVYWILQALFLAALSSITIIESRWRRAAGRMGRPHLSGHPGIDRVGGNHTAVWGWQTLRVATLCAVARRRPKMAV